MSRDKQIEEMVVIMCNVCAKQDYPKCDDRGGCICEELAEVYYNAGYRKASDVAREIFEEIDRRLSVDENGFNAIAEEGLSEGHAYCETYVHNLRAHLAELKRKYESEGADGEANH